VRIEEVKSGEKFQRANAIAARIRGGAAPLRYSGNMASTSFVERFRTKFVKAAPKGAAVIMDNASFHPPEKLKNPCRRHGARPLFLPVCSPDYNPIEKSRANMKHALIDIIPTCEDAPSAVYQYFCLDIS
jgi:putative transposase